MRFVPAMLAIGCSSPSDTDDDTTTEDTDTDTVGDTDPSDTDTFGYYTEDECVESHLEWWCFHVEADKGPVVPDTGMAHCADPSAEGAAPCGAYDMVTSGPCLDGIDHFFLDGEHVATRYWTDVNYYCGGFVFWYGEPVECP